MNQKKKQPEIVGLLPAAGVASRIGPLPCSKEVYPVGFHRVGERNEGGRPKVVSHYLLERMREAGITKTYIILREGKWDIPAYFRDGKILDMNLAYLMMDLPFGVPYTLDQAYPFVRDSTVAFGFPDIIFQPDNAFKKLISKQAESCAEIVLGLFPAYQPHKMDMVDLDKNGRIRNIQIKPARTHLNYTWIIAVWTSGFTHFMHDFVLFHQKNNDNKKDGVNVEARKELFLGDVIQAAIDNQIKIETLIFSDGSYLDIGTSGNLMKAVQIKSQF